MQVVLNLQLQNSRWRKALIFRQQAESRAYAKAMRIRSPHPLASSPLRRSCYTEPLSAEQLVSDVPDPADGKSRHTQTASRPSSSSSTSSSSASACSDITIGSIPQLPRLPRLVASAPTSPRKIAAAAPTASTAFSRHTLSRLEVNPMFTHLERPGLTPVRSPTTIVRKGVPPGFSPTSYRQTQQYSTSSPRTPGRARRENERPLTRASLCSPPHTTRGVRIRRHSREIMSQPREVRSRA